jgi:hypothetical protein
MGSITGEIDRAIRMLSWKLSKAPEVATNTKRHNRTANVRA